MMTPEEWSALESLMEFIIPLSPAGFPPPTVRALRFCSSPRPPSLDWFYEIVQGLHDTSVLHHTSTVRWLCSRRGNDGAFFSAILPLLPRILNTPFLLAVFTSTHECLFDADVENSSSSPRKTTQEKVLEFFAMTTATDAADFITPSDLPPLSSFETLVSAVDAFRAFDVRDATRRSSVFRTAQKHGISVASVLAGEDGSSSSSPPPPRSSTTTTTKKRSSSSGSSSASSSAGTAASAAAAASDSPKKTRTRRPRPRAFADRIALLACPLCRANSPCEVEGCSTDLSIVEETKGAPNPVYFACCISHGHICKRCSVSISQKLSKDKIKRVLFKSGELTWHASLEWTRFSFVDDATQQRHDVDASGTRVLCSSLNLKRTNPSATKLFVVEDEWGRTLRAHLRIGTANIWRVDPLRIVISHETVVIELAGRRFWVDLLMQGPEGPEGSPEGPLDGTLRVHCDATRVSFVLGEGGENLTLPTDTHSSSVAIKHLCRSAFPGIDMTDAEVRGHRAGRAALPPFRPVLATHLSLGIASRETQYPIAGFGFE